MDMSRVEERTLCKMLCGLAIQEPGDNWIYQVYLSFYEFINQISNYIRLLHNI